MRIAIGVGVGLVVAALAADPADARAQTEAGAPAGATARAAVELAWAAPSDGDCPSRRAIVESVERILGRPAFVEQAPVVLRGSIRPADGGKTGWRAEIALATGQETIGTRTLETESARCADFTESLALVIAVALESLETSAPEVLHVPSESPSRWQSELGALTEATAGLVPGLGPGGGLWAAVMPHPDWQIEIDVSRLWGRSALVDGHGATMDAFGLGAALCRRATPDDIAVLWGCASFDIAELHATGEELSVIRVASSVVPAAGPKVVGSLRIGRRWAVRAAFSGEFAFTRDRFYFGDAASGRTDIHRVGPLLITGSLGLGVRIP